jgi:acyl-CoA thioester hydrolase
MIEIGLGSVQTWECDAMGHFNVQHYVSRMTEGLAGLAIALGLGPSYARSEGAALAATEHHIRFLRELRPSAPFIISGGVLGIAGDTLRLYQEMRHTMTGAVAAAFVTEAGLFDLTTRAPRKLPADLPARAEALRVALPDHAAPKGLPRAASRPTASWAEADRLGLVLTQQGLVTAPDCDRHGFMLTRGYMGRISDAIPNMIVHTRGEDQSDDARIGGAALEYRLCYRSVPREGDVLALRSGLKAVGAKTVVWAHWLIDRESGQAVGTAEAVAVKFDLVARKVIDIDDAARARLVALVVPGLSL